MLSKLVTGDITYFGPGHSVRGRESFLIKSDRRGRTLTADVSILDRGVERSVVYEVDPHFAPQRCFVSVREAGLDHGAALYAFEDQRARLVSLDTATVAELPLPRSGLPYFGAHPIVMDGWIPVRALQALGSDVGPLEMDGGLTSSVEHDGASPAGLNRVTVQGEAQGIETIVTPAGAFLCHRIALSFGDEFREPHPPYRMWITTDPDHILVRAEVPAFQRAYELTRLAELSDGLVDRQAPSLRAGGV